MFNSIVTLNEIYINYKETQSEKAQYKNQEMSLAPILPPYALPLIAIVVSEKS